ncbi:MAG TPA: MFS transporter [Vicinamibacteria bacterium]|nr:MFS transporter [Vicinamibacteria bacterium]
MSAPGALDVRRAIEEGAMSRFQVLAVGLCVALNMIDGFDVLVMAFTASEVAREWNLSGARLGVLLSAGLIGMAAGSLFVAPWADRAGRRTVILVCLGVITAGMFLSALAQGEAQLAALRVATGVGIGGILASLNVITSEYSSRRWRSTAISLQVTGYPIGATIGGAIAAVLITSYGWRSAFLFGAAASAVMIPVVVRSLPESLDFLLARRPADALPRLNDLLRRMGRPEAAALPEPSLEPHAGHHAVRRLFAGGAARGTALIWASFFLVMFSFYFVTSWTPKLLVAAGLSTRQGITGGVLLNLGGIAGGLLFGSLVERVSLRRLTCLNLAATGAFLLLFAWFATDLASALAIGLGLGVFLFGSMVGLYAATPLLYPAAIRATGMGWAIGIGRLGAIVAPVTAGLLVDRGWDNSALYVAFALPLALAVLTVRALRV